MAAAQQNQGQEHQASAADSFDLPLVIPQDFREEVGAAGETQPMMQFLFEAAAFFSFQPLNDDLFKTLIIC